MNIILFGPQGSGKGTQARLLVQKYGFFYFESGDFLRKISETNEHVKKMLAEGTFVPDEEMASYVSSYLDEKGISDNVLFDGFPRSQKQYVVLKSWFGARGTRIDLVLVLKISEEETIRRLSARRQDPATGKIYNLITDQPPENINKDTLTQREDDKPEAIKKRLQWYSDFVMPLVDELKKETKVVELDGERSIKEIQNDLIKEIELLNK